MAAWPASLPQAPISDSYRETTTSGRIVSAMSTGPAKMRRRSTAVSRLYDVTYLFDASQRADFETFFHTTLEEGTLTFDWPDPHGATVSARVSGDSEPAYTAAGTDFYCGLRIEVLP